MKVGVAIIFAVAVCESKLICAEFRIFVENTEKELLALFKSIDRDDDGRLDKSELRGAFKKAGLSVPPSKLDQLFAEVDENNDVSLA
jgi:solute carrier family 25 phosphate transporter 23/24/25/41